MTTTPITRVVTLCDHCRDEADDPGGDDGWVHIEGDNDAGQPFAVDYCPSCWSSDQPLPHVEARR